MIKIETIMTRNPIFTSQHANVNKARNLMSEHKIRHLPVKDIDSGKLIGMITQKSLLANAIKIINRRGFDKLEHFEKSQDVESLMSANPATCSSDDSVGEAARLLRENRNGCIPVVKDEHLVGVVTSSDFLKLHLDES
ncbi:CBS domain-containing protein [Aliikangiella sp. G2MR2-5]|uniref:CBS domain-containing protein n=1 Tax=Aliikangiella sp. G2MR2-5 TaxID=2788943 RepID=UPI0018ABB72D|nr:CBS domain-containing protein [Aliikangiella sp. G2MR2-5]